MKKAMFSVTLGVAALLLMAFLSQLGAADKPPVKIGYVASITGPSALKVADLTRGVQLAVAEINGKGGIVGGRKIELLTYDAKSIPEETVTGVRKAIFADKVSALVGFEDAGCALAAKPIVMKAKIPMMCEMAIHPDLGRKPGEIGFFSSSVPADQPTLAQMKFDQDVLKVKSVTIIGPDFAFCWGIINTIKSIWDKPGSPVKVLDVVTFPFGSPDITAAILKAAAPKPDLVWSLAWGVTDNIQIFKQLSEVGYKGHVQQFLCTLLPQVLEGAGQTAEGAYAAISWGAELTNPESETFKAALAKEFGPKAGMSDCTEYGYTGTMALLLAMNKAGTVTNLAAISKACEDLNWVTPLGYKWEVGKNGLRVWKEITIVQAKNGKTIPVMTIPK